MQERNLKAEPLRSLTIENEKKIKATGVESVRGFSPARIVLDLTGGGRLTVTGNDLKITAFSKESGDFEATGSITGANYGARIASKLFK